MCNADHNIKEWKALEKELTILDEKQMLKRSEILKIGFFENLDKGKKKKSVLLEMSLLADYPDIQHATFLYAKPIQDSALKLEICLNVLFSQKLPYVKQNFWDELNFLKAQKDDEIRAMMTVYLSKCSNWRQVVEITEVFKKKSISSILDEGIDNLTVSSIAALLFVQSRDFKNMGKHELKDFHSRLARLAGVPGNPQAVFFLFSESKDKSEYKRLLKDANVDESLKKTIEYAYSKKK
jgi:hypothetical protein